MNKKAQAKFSTIERELVMLNKMVKNEDCKTNLRIALQYIGEAYNTAGGR